MKSLPYLTPQWKYLDKTNPEIEPNVYVNIIHYKNNISVHWILRKMVLEQLDKHYWKIKWDNLLQTNTEWTPQDPEF